MNPLLERDFFMADAEAHVMPDGRLYIVGSTDISGSRDYCSHVYHIWSTDDPLLRGWVDHGVVFENSAERPSVPGSPGTRLYAPDMAYKNGRYYLYICGSDRFEAVASSDSVSGPYGDVHMIKGADGDGIDPTVFVDDDGQAYYLWGQFSLRGAKLADNMYELEGEIKNGILTEQRHGFHEGASMRKINGRYYIFYTDVSRGKATCISYATSDHPLGPYEKGGVVVDNTYCDPGTWNDHGSVQYFGGRWFVFYHRSSQGRDTCRRVCAEPLDIMPDGSIKEAVMTSSGADLPVDAHTDTDASVACRVTGSTYITPDPENPGAEILTKCGGGSWAEAWAEYRPVDFGAGAKRFFATASGKGRITVMTEKDGRIGSVEINGEHRYEVNTGLSASPSGVQSLWLLFDRGLTDLISFRFE